MRPLFVSLLALSGWAVSPVIAPHATLVSSEPAANSHLTGAPSRVRLVYSEPVEGGLARVSIVGGKGTIVLRAGGDPRDVHAVIAPVDSLGPGAYRLDWRVVSADGHPVDGTFRFAVGDTTLGAAPVEPPATDTTTAIVPEPEQPQEQDAEPDVWGPSVKGAPVIPALFRGTGLGALMGVAGLLLFLVLAQPNAPQRADSRVRTAITMFAVAAPLLLGGHTLVWLINTSPDHTFDPAWAKAALGTSVGQVELIRNGLAVLALWAWALARRNGLALAFAAIALVVSGASGHSAAISPYIAVPAKAAHLLGSAVWFGGLLWLVVRPKGDSVGRFSIDALRVSTLALGGVIVVAVSGVIQTLLFLPSLGDLTTSAYGWFALVKTAGLLALVGFGAYHRQTLMPRVTSSGHDPTSGAMMRVSVGREIMVMIVVILIGGLLAYVPPPGEGGDTPTSTQASTP